MEPKNTVRLGRRAMLAAALGGAAAAAGALAAPARVLAANGDPLRIGMSNTGSASTRLVYTGADPDVRVLSVLTEAGNAVSGLAAGADDGAGVYGRSENVYSVGVRGVNHLLETAGVLGSSAAGVEAVQGRGELALSVAGKAHFSRSGVAVIAAGQRFVQVAVNGLTGSSFALATLQQYRANLWVQSITVSASTASIYIYVSERAPQATRVAWTVFD